MEKTLTKLQNLKHELFDSYRVDFKEKFEIVGAFMQDELEGVISKFDQAIDRINELEIELQEANERIEELEREE